MKIKKIIWFLLIVQTLCLFLVLSTSAASDNNLSFTLEPHSSKVNVSNAPVLRPGEEVVIEVVIDKNPGFRFAIPSLIYDPGQMLYVGAETSGSAFVNEQDKKFVKVIKQEDGLIKINIGDVNAMFDENAPIYTETGKVVALTFKLADDFDGDVLNISLKLSNVMVSDADGTLEKYSEKIEVLRPSTDENGNPAVGNVVIQGIPTDHGDADHVWQPATCLYPEHCKCGATRGEPLNDHNYGELIDAIAPTCEEDGMIAHYQCAFCKKYFDENKNELADIKIPAKQHQYGEFIAEVAATCEEKGAVAHYNCSECNKNFDADKNELADISISAKGHTYGALINGTDATCSKEGTVAHYKCSECSKCFDTEKRELADIKIPAKDHKWEAATCTAPKTCTVCGETSGETVGHKWEEASCTTPKMCTVCGITVGESAGHTPVTDPAVEATYSSEGKTEGSHCSVCDKVLTAQQTVPKKSTAWIWIVSAVIVVAVAGAVVTVVVLKKKK